MDTSFTEAHGKYFRDLLLERSAIVLDASKTYLIEARLQSLARNEGLNSLDELAERLQGQPYCSLHQSVVEALTTGETSWFRDHHPFELLSNVIIPELVESRAMSQKLTFWSAACASGQEPYTVAMILKERFPDLSTWDVQCLATDLSSKMIARTRDGIYNQLEVNRGLPAAMLVKYMRKKGTGWQIADEIRKMVDAREMNLMSSWTTLPVDIDVIFLRNVMIYFDIETKKEILSKVRRVLAPDGYLFLGGAETTLNLDDGFERLTEHCGSCYRLRKAA